MKPAHLILISAFAFSLIGLGAAWGIGICVPALPGQNLNFAQMMFVLLPLGGAIVGWFAAYLVTPLHNEKGG